MIYNELYINRDARRSEIDGILWQSYVKQWPGQKKKTEYREDWTNAMLVRIFLKKKY